MNTVLTDPVQTGSISSEAFFCQTLVLERKKTERSGRGFLVVLLDVAELLRSETKPVPVLLDGLASALSASTREVDVKGWYRFNLVLGIICSEVTIADREKVVTKIKNKLGLFFDSRELSKISLHVINYPEYETRFSPNAQTRAIPELQPERKGMFYS